MKRSLYIIICLLFTAALLAACGVKTRQAESSATAESSAAETVAESMLDEQNETVTSAQDDKTKQEETEGEEIKAGTSKDDAPIVPLRIKVSGTVKDGITAWYAFTTNEHSTYYITSINRTVGSYDLKTTIYDANDNELYTGSASSRGAASTIIADQLDPNTTYYIRVSQNNGADFSLFITDISDSSAQNPVLDNTTVKLETSGTEIVQVKCGTNQDEAVLLPIGTKVSGTVPNDITYSWYAFTTDENTAYKIIAVNKSLGSGDLSIRIYDEYGNTLTDGKAGSRGVASAINVDGLSHNTTYYISASSASTLDYMLMIQNPNAQSVGYNTAGNLSESRGTSDILEGKVYPGTNQDDAAIIPFGVKVSGTVQNDTTYSWFAFRTGEDADATYNITSINDSPGTYDLQTKIYDEYGNELSHASDSHGESSIISLDQLSPNTLYYISVSAYYINVSSATTLDYTLFAEIQAKEAPPEAVEDPLVFETPFELNQAQVMFKAESAEFVDPEAAEAALKPVAEVILAHPDHPVLLAGTTATDGSQEARVDLSNRRAAAVKKLLVDSFDVPESQLLTVGLGFEADPFVRGKDRDANGKFVETEGAKNRRVVVMDANAPVAKELLGQ